MDEFSYDFLVLGSGLAGLSAAIHASALGKVALVTKSTLDVSNSYWAQGGIAAAIDPEDSPDYQFADTLKAGAGLCHKDSVKILVEEGKERIFDLINLGMEFDKENGKIALGLEGSHSHRRVLHAAGDATGREIIKFLISKVRENKNIDIYEKEHVFSLITKGKTCYGLVSYNIDSKKTDSFFAKATIIATGGASGIYSRTTNPHSSTGDGIILAYEAGADVANMEMIQFHPSSLVTNTKATFLISEAVRGEGAYLINSHGERFMKDKHELAELAPRDIVAFEMHKQLKEKGNQLFLTLDHLDKERIRKRFSNIQKELDKYGLDIATDPIPVAPAAHYMIGGIKTGLHGETNIDRLYACGEVSCTGVHGANRLASNSLLECLVFGRRSVLHAYEMNKDSDIFNKIDFSAEKLIVDDSKKDLFVQSRNRISEILTEKVGIVRTKENLENARKEFDNILSKFEVLKNEYYGLRLMSFVKLCNLIAKSAIIREESRGAHKRVEFRDKDDKNFLIDIVQNKDKETELLPI